MTKQFLRRWVVPPGFYELASRAKKAVAPPPDARDPVEAGLLARSALLRDRHKGERCFVLGAGPSVKRQDLRKLAGEIVLSVSNTFVHPDFPVFRPRYHAVPHVLTHAHHHSTEAFVAWLAEMEERTFDAEMFFHVKDRQLLEDNGLFRGRVIHWVDYCDWSGAADTPLDLARVPHIWSVSELAITIALYLGFDRIYLLGIDHDWFRGFLRFFYDEKTEHKVKPDASDYPHVDAEFQMRRHADIFRKYKYLYGLRRNIYNANADPDHYLDVFPRVDYDSLFAGGKAVAAR